jgi:iron complex outermembrane receptor protein
MKNSYLAASVLVLAVIFFSPQQSQAETEQGKEDPAAKELDEVVVSSTPLKKSLFDSAQSISVLDEQQLLLNSRPSLGETLSNQPGISSTSYGQGASRPIIRGLGGDRVRILQGGVGVQDASNTSPDHAVALDPIQSNKVEVVRGAATLMYGPNAIGGVVNVIDNRIPEEMPEGPATGAVELKTATVDGLRSGGAKIDVPLGTFALHLDGFYRKSDNYRIPGFARDGELREGGIPEEFGFEPKDKLPQSFTQAEGATAGLSYIFEKGYLGVAANLFNTTYGLPISEPNVSIGMQQRRFDLRGRIDDALPFIDRIESRTGLVNYEHTEFEGDEVGTIFKNDGVDSRLELTHSPVGMVEGMFGLQYQYSDFAAIGAEAFVPASITNTISGFAFEELTASENLSFQAGGRLDSNRVRTTNFRVDEDALPETLNSSPTSLSGSIGTVYKFLDRYAAAFTITHTERAPTSTELFANGAHLATGVFELGNPNLGKEKALGFDLTLRKRSGWVTGFVSGYYNRFDNFINLNPTGRFREGGHGHGEEEEHEDDAKHEEDHHDEDHGSEDMLAAKEGDEEEGELPEYRFQAADADYFGSEAQVVFHLFGPKEEEDVDSKTRILARGISENSSSHDLNHLDLITQVDFVRAYDRQGSGNISQVPPWRLLLATDYRKESFGARLEAQHVFRQDIVSQFENETDSYTLVNAILTKDFMIDAVPATGFLRLDNIFDDEARVHTSFVRNRAPLPGRNATLGLRFTF